MWCRLFWLLFVFYVAGRQCLAESNDIPPKKEEKPKVVYTKPTVPQDSVLALTFDSPKDISKLIFSEATKEGVNVDIAKYDGKWEVEVPKTSLIEGDYSLILKSEGKHHAVAIDIGKDLQFNKDEFVVQYEVRFMEGLSCGGAYAKLLSASKDMNLSQFHDKTPYTIMFGPDKCGLESKIHFIFRHKNPKTGKFEEKHMKQPTESLESFFTDKKTHLYTLVIRSDNSFEVYVDQSLIKSGNLLSDFMPPVNPPSEIDDPSDKMPSDWDDRVQIPDATATKPDDWDEDAPKMVRDEAATMPEGWLENEPKLIAKPDAEQPADWDSETDGDWEPPMIDNPACASVPGCGKWEKPMIPNPDYKGKWSPPMITNKGYKGEWKPKKIPNPDYFEDTEPYRMTPIRALGLELWTMSAQIAFDNFYIGASKKGADSFAEETWVIKRNAEKASGKSVVDAVRDLADEKPWIIAVAIGVFLLVALLIFWCCRNGGGHTVDAVHKKTDDVTKDNTEDEEEEEDKEKHATGEDKKKASDESGEEEEEEKGEIAEHSDGQEEDEPKKSVRQRTRKE